MSKDNMKYIEIPSHTTENKRTLGKIRWMLLVRFPILPKPWSLPSSVAGESILHEPKDRRGGTLPRTSSFPIGGARLWFGWMWGAVILLIVVDGVSVVRCVLFPSKDCFFYHVPRCWLWPKSGLEVGEMSFSAEKQEKVQAAVAAGGEQNRRGKLLRSSRFICGSLLFVLYYRVLGGCWSYT